MMVTTDRITQENKAGDLQLAVRGIPNDI